MPWAAICRTRFSLCIYVEQACTFGMCSGGNRGVSGGLERCRPHLVADSLVPTRHRMRRQGNYRSCSAGAIQDLAFRDKDVTTGRKALKRVTCFAWWCSWARSSALRRDRWVQHLRLGATGRAREQRRLQNRAQPWKQRLLTRAALRALRNRPARSKIVLATQCAARRGVARQSARATRPECACAPRGFRVSRRCCMMSWCALGRMRRSMSYASSVSNSSASVPIGDSARALRFCATPCQSGLEFCFEPCAGATMARTLQSTLASRFEQIWLPANISAIHGHAHPLRRH